MKKISPSKNSRINWGTGILIGIIVFVTISITMTVIFMTQDVNLVTDKYYENSMQYQNEIDNQGRTLALNEEIEIGYNGQAVNILFPTLYASKKVSGELFFYRPSDPSLDFKIPLLLDERGSQIIPTERIAKGFWRLKLNWMMDGNGYYNERAITIE